MEGKPLWKLWIFILAICFLQTAGWANEEEPAVPEPAELELEVSEEPEPTPIAPPALKPITITFSGELKKADLQTDPPTFTVEDRYGVQKELELASDVSLTDGEKELTAAAIPVGSRVTVEYTYDVATGKRTARTVTLESASP